MARPQQGARIKMGGNLMQNVCVACADVWVVTVTGLAHLILRLKRWMGSALSANI